MSESSELSVATVVALVLGGLAAVVLAVVVANKEPRRVHADGAATSASGAPSQAPLGSAAPNPSGEIEVPAELLYPIESGTASEP